MDRFAEDIKDPGRTTNALATAVPQELARSAYEKYGEDSVPLVASKENYEIVAEEAMAAAAALRRY